MLGTDMIDFVPAAFWYHNHLIVISFWGISIVTDILSPRRLTMNCSACLGTVGFSLAFVAPTIARLPNTAPTDLRNDLLPVFIGATLGTCTPLSSLRNLPLAI